MTLATPRQIRLIPKSTGARTQYFDISTEDEQYIYRWLIQFLADMSELATHEPEIQKEYFQRKPRVFPKGHKGPNSYASFIGGIVSAKTQNPKHNISEPQLEGLERIFEVIADYYDDQPQSPQRIQFRRSLFDHA